MFWKLIAKLLQWKWLQEKLILSAMDRPHRLQLGDYMDRWWLLPRTRWLPFAIRIHHIKRRDYGVHLHNHPGTFRTFILRGWYCEARKDERSLSGEKYRVVKAGKTMLVKDTDFHVISSIDPQGCLTLVIEYGKWQGRRWGFEVDGEFVDHEDYHGTR